MSMVIISSNIDINPWIKSFKEYDKTLDIQIYPDIKNKDDITFALVWSKNECDFKEFKNLKCIASMGAGVNHILENKTISKDIFITKIKDEELVNSMWEYLLSVVMNVTINCYKYINQQSKNQWITLQPRLIKDTTIGILGLGQLGSAMAINFSNIGFKVKGYSKSQKNIQNIKTYTTIDGFAAGIDILINLLPLTNATINILNKKFFSKFKKGLYLINVGRGEHLDEDDFTECINNAHLVGATLDVFKGEPLEPDHPFWNMQNIIITPHIASITDPVSVTNQIMENYDRVSLDLKPINTINTVLGY